MLNLDGYTKAAIIGYWRSGASVVEIYLITEFSTEQISKIINDHNSNSVTGTSDQHL